MSQEPYSRKKVALGFLLGIFTSIIGVIIWYLIKETHPPLAKGLLIGSIVSLIFSVFISFIGYVFLDLV